MRPTAEDRRSATEDRLRAALAARAALVTYGDLRRGAPPQGRSWGVRRVRRTGFAVLGAAAAVVAVCLLVLLPGSPLNPAPAPPAHAPRVTDPPQPTPTGPIRPSVVSPGVTEHP
ncbi:hypothetical protein OG204_23690 [Streptomyces sp. NBC_01387]|uniref:hypothetical protein n=1 Tax=unclassified Streptomyces TaxID=2593676 RepID=UPI002DD8A15E|nr:MULTISPECIES: hypothetical protein [unclassified Streptomyces]WSC20275.1 hypothetical protein OIE60_11580 [Streptomyces sp. NBC_01766]WSV54295.1 hypothetical protein OG282_11560 [Streptomyces sp. NBC_01014]